MSVSGVTNYSNSFRISGLASGLDTDQIISDMMKIERIKYDKVEQSKQIEEWKRDDYREIISLLNEFKSGFLDFVRPENNMLSLATFKKYNITVNNTTTGDSSNVVSVRPSANAISGTHTIKVERLATADEAISMNKISNAVSAHPSDFSLKDKNITVTLDNVTKVISLDDYTDIDDLINKEGTGLQNLLDTAFGEGKVLVSNVSDQLQFDTVGGASLITFSGSGPDSAFEQLGFDNGASNRISLGKSLGDLAERFSTELVFDDNNQLVFSINDKEFTFNRSDSLTKVMNTISNDPDIKISMAYNEITDKITLTSGQLGAGDNIKISQKGGNFFEAIGISVENPVTTEGMDARVYIDGEMITRSSNEFSVNGVTYTLNAESEDVQKINIVYDPEQVFDKIIKFVDKYNEVIDKINEKLNEEYDRDFLPLTQEQKNSMSEDEIRKWEEKAKSGLLRNDKILKDIVYNMRTALYDPVEGVDSALYNIGITTGNWFQRGKLVVNEDKLRNAIRETPDLVMNLFTKQSEVDYNDLENRPSRLREEGIAYRIFDVIQDNVRLTRVTVGKNSYKGILLEKAGMIGDSTEFENTISKSIRGYEDRMDNLYRALIAKEEAYYRQFSQLERVMNQMNAQYGWLMSQFGGGY